MFMYISITYYYCIYSGVTPLIQLGFKLIQVNGEKLSCGFSVRRQSRVVRNSHRRYDRRRQRTAGGQRQRRGRVPVVRTRKHATEVPGSDRRRPRCRTFCGRRTNKGPENQDSGNGGSPRCRR